MKTEMMMGLLLLSTTTFAGGVGNGGGVHSCPDREVKATFYDLYEGKEASPRSPIPVFETAYASKEVMQRDALLKLNSINPFFAEQVAKYLKHVQNPKNFMLLNKRLTKIEDANFLWVDNDCTYEQLASWNDQFDFIYINQKYYQQLDELSLSAFEMHEAIYKAGRNLIGIQTSDNVRKLVAYLFSHAETPKQLVHSLSGQYSGISSSQVKFGLTHLKDDVFSLSLGPIDMETASLTKVRITFVCDAFNEAIPELALLEEKLKYETNKKARKQLLKQIHNIKLAKVWRISLVPKGEAYDLFSVKGGNGVLELDLGNQYHMNLLRYLDFFSSTWIAFTGQNLANRPRTRLKMEKIVDGVVVDVFEQKDIFVVKEQRQSGVDSYFKIQLQ